ncbi:MAG: hypothetical protein QM647_18795 [Asticcacaulis sp.]|uniref:hypothetical protein n=1 Tax=Asticcacaulis sp. TaxID=1872648 RepID=UPI0039E721ED
MTTTSRKLVRGLLLAGTASLLWTGMAMAQETPPGPPQGPPPAGMPEGMAPPLGPDGQPLPMTGFGDSKPVNIGIHIKDGAYMKADSQLAKTVGSKVKAKGATGLKLASAKEKFNALYVDGAGSDFTLADSQITLSGTGGDDASGIGSAAVAAYGGVLTLKNVKIETSAPVSSAVVSTGKGAVVRVYNSELITHGGPLPADYKPHIGPGMMEAPPPLGIKGTARAVNTTMGGVSYYYDTKIISDGWGALSTDAGGKYIECNRCYLETIKSGYGTYTDNGIELVVNDTVIKSATFVSIIAGQNKTTLNNVNATSGDHGIMIHNVMGRPTEVATLTIKGGSYTTGKSSFWIKSANADITVDGATFAPGDGLILQSIVNDDANATKPTDQSPGIKADFRNSTLNGGIQGDDDKRKLMVTLENSRLTGAVNHAGLALESGSTWTATGNSELILFKGSLAQIDAPAGVAISARAQADTLVAGTYKLASGGTLSVAN